MELPIPPSQGVGVVVIQKKRTPVTPSERPIAPKSSASPISAARSTRPSAAAAPAQTDFAAVDRHALAAPPGVEADVERLAAYLARGAATERHKARAIFRWIADRIEYDGPAFRSGALPDPDPAVTLARRKAVCGGYAELYAALGRKMGLQVEVISGTAKILGADRSDPTPNHAWNAVLLDGRWELVESTWGAGSLNEGSEFKKEFMPEYFCVAPDTLLCTHFPEQPKWQLRPRPISRSEFWARPRLRPAFYQQGLKVLGEAGSPLRVHGTARLQVEVPESVGLRAGLSSGGRQLENYALVTRQGRTCTVEVTAPAAGQYELSLFVGKPGEATFTSCAEWEVEAGERLAPPFPDTYIGYEQHSARLSSPRSGVLRAGQKELFVIEAAGAEEMMIQNGDEQLDLIPVGQTFKGEYALQPGTATVFARYPGEPRYVGLAEYQVK